MSREKIYQSLWAAVLGFALTFGSLGCLATGMGLLSGKSLVSLALWCAVCAIGFSALNLLRAAPWFGLFVPLVLAWQWFYGPLAASAERLVFEITTIYHNGYGWKVLYWTSHPTAGAMMPAFRALAVLLLLPECYAITRRGSVWTALPLTVLPLAATLALVDTVPKEGLLMLYLFGAVMLLLSQSVRRRQASQGNVLCAQIALPVAAVLALIFLLNPQKGYNKQHLAEKIDEKVSAWLGEVSAPDSTVPSGGQVYAPAAGDTGNAVSLENIGPKGKQTQVVMSVTASHSGRLYLRGASYGEYTGRAWLPGYQTDYYDQWPAFHPDTRMNTLTVTTKQAHSVVYLPYYTPKLSELTDGRLENSGGRTYSLHYYIMTAENVQKTGEDRVAKSFTSLPDHTASWASAQALALIGREVDPQKAEEVVYAAQAIRQFVAGSARYSLNTPKMPKEEEDFARWFLNSSDTGYCTHFATAATVLLRGAGIPARYVSGYAFTARGEKSVNVTLADAHAWVEYYIPGIGWAVLDPTPGNEAGEQQLPIATRPPATTPQATTPGETSAPDQTTEPQPTPTLPGDVPGRPTSPHSGPAAAPGKEDAQKGVNLGWLKYLLWPLAILALILGQWQLRLWLRSKALGSRRGNRRAMLYWRRCEGLAAQLGEKPPKDIRELAQKAKFSQHKLSREELSQMRGYLTVCENRLRKHPWYKQLYYRLVLALY